MYTISYSIIRVRSEGRLVLYSKQAAVDKSLLSTMAGMGRLITVIPTRDINSTLRESD